MVMISGFAFGVSRGETGGGTSCDSAACTHGNLRSNQLMTRGLGPLNEI